MFYRDAENILSFMFPNPSIDYVITQNTVNILKVYLHRCNSIDILEFYQFCTKKRIVIKVVSNRKSLTTTKDLKTHNPYYCLILNKKFCSSSLFKSCYKFKINIGHITKCTFITFHFS